MKPNPTTSQPQWPRLVSEFFVIVLGVLVALGVDSWASSSSDRQLEREYLGRLLEDVTYDVGELEFIRAVSASGLAYTDTLLSGRGLEFHGDRLVGSALIASIARVPDLSRNTFQELVASGRIGLFRSTTVRLALARYDRAVTEQWGSGQASHMTSVTG